MNHQHPTRRDVLSACAAFPVAAHALSQRDQRPDVLLVLASQHRHDAAGFAGTGHANTPNLDALAAGGTSLRDAYCQVPLGIPSQQSLLTGQYASTHGNFSKRLAQVPGEKTFAHDFQQAGYATAWVGFPKCNTNGFETAVSSNDLLAEFRQAHPDAKLPGGAPGRPNMFAKNLQGMNPDYRDLRDGPVFHMEEHVSAKASAMWQRRAKDRPLFLVASYQSPQPPLFPPQDFLELYRDANLSFERDYRALDAHPFRDLNRRRRTLGWRTMSEAAAHNMIRAYYASIAWMDHCVGQLLQHLDSKPAGRDTLVIYTSDHGTQLGEHGLWQSRTLYDASARVPMILSWPGQIAAGVRLPRVVEHLDLIASMYELCSVTSTLDSPGRSFASMLRGMEQPWEDRARMEMSLQSAITDSEQLASNDGPPAAGFWALRMDDWKYIEHDSRERALFQISEDPGELRSRIHDPSQAERAEAMRSMLMASNPDRWAFHQAGKR